MKTVSADNIPENCRILKRWRTPEGEQMALVETVPGSGPAAMPEVNEEPEDLSDHADVIV